jgi:hypothetical protein
MILKLILQAIMSKKGVAYHQDRRHFLECFGEEIYCIEGVWYRKLVDTTVEKIWTKGLPDLHFMHYVIRYARLSGKCITISAEKLDDVFDAARNPTSPESLQLLEEELLRLKKEKEQKEQERREALERKEQERLIIWYSLSDAERASLIRWAKNH